MVQLQLTYTLYTLQLYEGLGYYGVGIGNPEKRRNMVRRRNNLTRWKSPTGKTGKRRNSKDRIRRKNNITKWKRERGKTEEKEKSIRWRKKT